MSIFSKPRYKQLIRIRFNIWNNLKFIKFYKKKWKISKKFLIKKRHRNKNNKLFYYKKLKIRHMYRLRLNTRKIFCSSYGNYKKKQLINTIKKSDNRGLSLKIKNLYFNNHTLNSVKNSYDSLLYVMHAFDSKLIVSLFRLGNFKSIFLVFFAIRHGFIEVDGKVIKNPYYVLKNLSIISIKCSFISKYLNKLKLINFKFYKKRRKYNKTFKIKNIIKVGKKIVQVKPIKKKRIFYYYLKYLLVLQSSINIKYVYIKPKFSELDGRYLFNWNFLSYLTRLKRL